MHLRFFPGFLRIKEQERFVFAESLFVQADQVCLDFVGCFLINPVNLLVSGIGNLLGVFRQFNLRKEFPVLPLDRCQLINAAKGRIVFCRNQVRSHTPGGDRRSLRLQRQNQVFIQVIGCGDNRIREARLI